MNIRTRFGGWALAAIGAAFLSAVPARAGVVISIQSVDASFGSSGDTLDVSLTNNGPSDINVSVFAFQITTASTDITFDSTDFNTTSPYIFAGDSLIGPTLNTFLPGQSMDGIDLSLLGGEVVAAGTTVGLGHVTFHVSPTAVLGPVAVTLISTGTSLDDNNNNGIPIDNVNETNGQITITGVTAVPEPASALLLSGALLGFVALKKTRGTARR